MSTRQIAITDGEFDIAIGATNAASANQIGFYRYKCCAIDEVGLEVNTDKKEKFISCRGVRKKIKVTNRETTLMYKLTLTSIGLNAAQMAYFGDPDHDFGSAHPDNRQNALASVDGNPFNFDLSNGGVAYQHGKWMRVQDVTGADVTNIEVLTLVGGVAQYGAAQDSQTLVEGVDFELDAVTGMVRFNRAIDNDTLTPNISAPEILGTSAEYRRKIKPMSKPHINGVANIRLFDEEGVFLTHENFSCNLIPSGGWTAGEDYMTTEVEVEVLDINPDAFVTALPELDFLDAVI